MTSLIVRESPESAPASWVPGKLIALPVEATSAAWAVARGGSLRLWVNRPGSGTTLQARIDPTGAIASDSLLPWLLAGVAQDEQTTLVTGADAGGHPIVAALDAGGKPAWQHRIDGPAPLQWPVPALLPEPVIVWQTQANEVQIAKVGAGGVGGVRRVAVGAPSPQIAVAGNSGWIAWLDRGDVFAMQITADGERNEPEVRWFLPRADTFALGMDARGLCAAWSAGASGGFGYLEPRGGAVLDSVALDLADAAPGTLRILGGRAALVWAQRLDAREPAPPQWRNALSAPGKPACRIEGLVHSMAGWGDGVAVVGGSEILVLQPMMT
jgi:hypothetical protein